MAVVVIASVLAVPVISASSWKTETATELTEMFTATQENTEASIAFAGKTEPTKADISAEIERVKATQAEVLKASKNIDDLGPNTIDVTKARCR